MIDLEKLMVAIFVLLSIAVVAGQSYKFGQRQQPTCPEPIPVVCMVRAIHPATDGGEMLTVHCPEVTS